MLDTINLPDQLAALPGDLASGSIELQIGVIVLSLLAAWLARRLLYLRLLSIRPVDPEATVRISVGGMNRLVFPLTALALVLVGRWILRRHYPVHLLDLAAPLLFSLALVHTAVYLLRHAFAPSGVLRSWERALAWSIWIGFALHILGLLPELRDLLDSVDLPLGNNSVTLFKVLSGMLSVAVTVIIALWLGRTIEDRLQQVTELDASLREVAAKLSKIALVALAVLIALPLVGIDLTVLSVFGGALGVGIGLGLQKIAGNYISGFIILLDRSVSPGALVTVEGRFGSITRLTARYIVLKSLDGTEAIIPNETVVSSTVINHTYSSQAVRVDVPIQVSYQSDVERALQLMREAAQRHPRASTQQPPVALLKQFGESGIDLELYVWIADPEAGTANLRSDLYLELWKAFRANDISIPFPQREVRILDSRRTAGGA